MDTAVAIEPSLEETINEYITFTVKGEIFAINMAPVREIIRVPEMVHVPKSPPSLLGLANLRGQVLPVLDLRRIFGIESREIDEASRVIVTNFSQTLGFLVDKVSSVINVEESEIEDSSQIQSIVKSEYLKGVIKDKDNKRMIMLLDLEKILRCEFEGTFNETEKVMQSDTFKRDIFGEEELQSEERQLVSFMVEGEEYAIEIEQIQEIVQIPEHIIRVPNSDSSVIGIMNLRSRVLPLTSLRKIFNLEERALDERSRIIVISLNGISIGIVVDSVKEVLRVHKSQIEPAPSMLFRESDAEITEICRLQDGKRLVSIISVSNLFKTKAVREALNSMNQETTQDVNIEIREIDDEEQVVVFQLQGEEYAVSIEAVQEIVRIPEELTHIPKTPKFVEGVINLRGSVLPVIDLRKRFDMKEKERDEQQRIMVFLIDNLSVGFIVDSVTEVLKIPKKLIFESPKLSQDQARLFPKVANLEKTGRIIQFIEPKELLKKEEIEEIIQSRE